MWLNLLIYDQKANMTLNGMGTWMMGTWMMGTWMMGTWMMGTWMMGTWMMGTWMMDGPTLSHAFCS